MKEDKYKGLKLENQMCFPLYVVSKEITRKYKPYLDELGLTYTQYIAMMVLWEQKSINVKELGEYLYLDSGTLTPMLKKMEQKGLVKRQRSKADERVLVVEITTRGMELREKAVDIPTKMRSCIGLELEETLQLYKLLNKLMQGK